MILPGFPVMLGGGNKAAPPFSVSGGWETGMEGWVPANGTWAREDSASIVHAGSWALFNGSVGTTSIDYVLPADMVKGLVITASVWHRTFVISGSPSLVSRSLNRDIGAGFSALGSAADSSTTYAQFSGSFAAGDSDVILRLTASRTHHPNISCVFFDTWAISGALP